ncbi:hypothetical protein MYXO_02937 [Myxococcaceae bacterium]|nr:hypothetical protein MYXO_02937 [Myxococcaceae bacterium]
MAKIFVGIPTRNRADYVREAIRCVVEQTFRDVRIVVSDNASEPEVVESLESFVKELDDPRIELHLQPEDIHETGQGRFFFERCREEYFVILHDDDRLEPTYLETALSRLDSDAALACFVADPYVFDAKGVTSADATAHYLAEHGRAGRSEGAIPVLEPLLESGFIPISGTFFRTAALRDSGFVDEECRGNFPFEFNLLLRLGERGARAHYLPRVLLGFRFHDAALRVTMKPWSNPHVLGSMIGMLERRRFAGHAEALRIARLAQLHRGYGLVRASAGESAASREHLLRALRLAPFSPRNWLYACAAIAAPGWLRSFVRRNA